MQKKNAITGETTSQGLGGAVFSIEYYAQEIDKDYDVKADETAPALDSKNLKRTWYIQTDEDGYCDLNKNILLRSTVQMTFIILRLKTQYLLSQLVQLSFEK